MRDEIKAVPRDLRGEPGWYAWSGMTGWQPVTSSIFDNVDHQLSCTRIDPKDTP